MFSILLSCAEANIYEYYKSILSPHLIYLIYIRGYEPLQWALHEQFFHAWQTPENWLKSFSNSSCLLAGADDNDVRGA
jgi:hypothetical protein